MKYIRKETIIYAVIAAACIAVFFLTGKQAALVVLAVLGFYALFAWLSVFVCGRKINVSLSAPRELSKGKAGLAEITIENGSVLPAARCDIRVKAGNQLTGTESVQVFRAGARPKGNTTLPIDIGDRYCGMLGLKVEEAAILDPLGILKRTMIRNQIPKHIQKQISVHTLVLPELSSVEIDPEHLWHYDMESYRFAEGAVGNDTSETVGIREYLPGDNVRLIHWKLSAKTGEIQIREPGLPIDNRLMLIADKKMPGAGAEPEKISSLSEFFLSVSLTLAEKGLGHTVGWYDIDKNEYMTEQIAVPDDVFRIMPEFLAAPLKKDRLDAGERFIEADTEKNYASYMIVTSDEEACASGADRIRSYGHLTVLTQNKTE